VRSPTSSALDLKRKAKICLAPFSPFPADVSINYRQPDPGFGEFDLSIRSFAITFSKNNPGTSNFQVFFRLCR